MNQKFELHIGIFREISRQKIRIRSISNKSYNFNSINGRNGYVKINSGTKHTDLRTIVG